MKLVNSKTNKEIALEWDNVSATRFQQISSNKDLSFNHILKPCIIELINQCNMENVLDFGCGTGNLTNFLADYSDEIVGIDISEKSIEIAIRNFSKENLRFHNRSIEEFSKDKSEVSFSLITANMVLMDVTDLANVIRAIKDNLRNNGHFVFTITHPCYWPVYWDYIGENWFNYNEELFIESQFKISLEEIEHKTTHIHRPLEQYVNALFKEGFIIEKMIEPIPDDDVLSLFPSKELYPRFMGLRCKLI